MGDLDKKIKEIELQLRAKNDGNMPEIPKPMSQQLEEFLSGSTIISGTDQMSKSGNEPSQMQNGQPSFKSGKLYITDKRLVDLRGIKSDTDQVSALVHMCKQAFQLEPTFDFEEMPGQSRFKFKAGVKFHG